MSGEGLPVLLTVEEAGEVLRIGRTKAYAMAREWRETGGRSGLPVIDLGHTLRVPRKALETLIGSDLSSARIRPKGKSTEPAGTPTPNPTGTEAHETKHSPTTRRNQSRSTDQLDLFAPKPRPR